MCVSFRLLQNKIIHALNDKAMLFMKPGRAIFTKNRGGEGWFCVNNGKFSVDGGHAVMIPLMTSKERNLSRLWDSSGTGFKSKCVMLKSRRLNKGAK